jgi:hypothetical protein
VTQIPKSASRPRNVSISSAAAKAVAALGATSDGEGAIVNSVVYTAGDALTYERLADIVHSVLGRKLQRVQWSVPMLKDELANDANIPIKNYRVVFAQGRGVSWEVGKKRRNEDALLGRHS